MANRKRGPGLASEQDNLQVDMGGGVFVDAEMQVGTNEQVGGDGAPAWLALAAVNTPQTVDVAHPDEYQGDAAYVVHVSNPSLVTALTVIVYNRLDNFRGGTRYCEVDRFSVAANSDRSRPVLGWMQGTSPARVILSNDSALGAGDAFTAAVRVTKP